MYIMYCYRKDRLVWHCRYDKDVVIGFSIGYRPRDTEIDYKKEIGGYILVIGDEKFKDRVVVKGVIEDEVKVLEELLR